MPEDRASRLVRFLVRGPGPVILCLLFWGMNLRSLAPWLLPLLGALIACSTLLPAALFARWGKLSGPQTGSFLACAVFSNLGYLGAFIAFALFGETAYGLGMLYLMFFTPCFYTLGFWIGSRYGGTTRPTGMGAAFTDELRLYPFVGMLVGLTLSLLGVPRPAPFERLNGILIPVDTALLSMAIGSQLTCEPPLPWLRPCLAMSAIKFFYAPLVAWGLLNLFGFEGLTRTVVLLQASMPVGVSPLMLPLLFRLDRRLANALWLWTTLLVIPWLLVLIPLLPHL
jgi:predicted permease